jgi:hypothetical protein
VYWDVAGVDPWDEERDARRYAGPFPVVAHPPCSAWCRLAGFREHVHGYKRGEDNGCFEAALTAVRTWGGVLEHPAFSDAWPHFGLPKPKVREGWTVTLSGEAVCYLEQGRYGLPVKKATWLYAVGVDLPELRWGWVRDCDGTPGGIGMDRWRDSWRPALRRGWRINEPRDGDRARVTAAEGRMRGRSASRTPIELRDALIATARSAHVARSVAA